MDRLRNPHPGDTLSEELEERGVTPERFAQEIGMDEAAVSQICRGKRRVTARTALRLSDYFGTSAEFWMNLQSAYDLEEERLRIERRGAAATKARTASVAA